MFDFLSYINVDTPVNFQNFIEMFSYNIFSIFPNLFDIDDTKYECRIHPKLKDNELSCLTVNNMGSNLPFMIAIIVLYFLGKMFDFGMIACKVDQNKVLKNRKKSAFYWIIKIKKYFGLPFYWAVFTGMQLDLLLGGLAVFKIDIYTDSLTLTSGFLTLFILFNIVVYFGMLGKAYYQFVKPKYEKLYSEEVSNTLEHKNEEFLLLFDSYKIDNPKSILFMTF